MTVTGSTERRALLRAAAVALLSLAACAHVKDQHYDLVIPPPPEPARYKLEHVYRSSEDYGGGSKAADIFLGKRSASEAQTLFKPFDVVSDGKGTVYVSDTAKPPRVAVFDDVKKEVRAIGVEGEGRLLMPLGLALGPDGALYVADAKLKVVLRYDPTGKFERTLGNPKDFERPSSIAIDPTRKLLYVADTTGHRVRVLSLDDGRLVRTIGERGAAPGKFNYPEGVAVGKDGKVYVVDSMNFRYQVFDPDGNFLETHGKIGQEPGAFARPKGIALDSDGHVYVSDAAFANVQVFDAQGRLLILIGGPGAGPGQFQLAEGVSLDPADKLFVVDQYNKRVQRFAYLHVAEPAPGGAAGKDPGASAPAAAPAASGSAATAPGSSR